MPGPNRRILRVSERQIVRFFLEILRAFHKRAAFPADAPSTRLVREVEILQRKLVESAPGRTRTCDARLRRRNSRELINRPCARYLHRVPCQGATSTDRVCAAVLYAVRRFATCPLRARSGCIADPQPRATDTTTISPENPISERRCQTSAGPERQPRADACVRTSPPLARPSGHARTLGSSTAGAVSSDRPITRSRHAQ